MESVSSQPAGRRDGTLEWGLHGRAHLALSTCLRSLLPHLLVCSPICEVHLRWWRAAREARTRTRGSAPTRPRSEGMDAASRRVGRVAVDGKSPDRADEKRGQLL
jgi:hypothetical protein